jgi:hypothetical protein
VRIEIRAAVPADIEWLVAELKSFSSVYRTKLPLFDDDEKHGREVLSNMIQNHLFLVAEHDSIGVGFIGGLVSPHFFNPKIRTLFELFWWVGEKYRGSRAGSMLLNSFVEWGKKNVDWITCSLEQHSQVKDESLLKRGFKCHERSFLLEVL